MKRLVLICIVSSLLSCTPGVVSSKFKQKAISESDIELLFNDPDSYTGRKVILGGVIVNATVADEENLIEIIEKPLDYYEAPELDGTSRGRFIVVYRGHLKRGVYSKGREITVAGEVAGQITRNDRAYLMINGIEMHLFKPKRKFDIKLVPGEFYRER